MCRGAVLYVKEHESGGQTQGPCISTLLISSWITGIGSNQSFGDRAIIKFRDWVLIAIHVGTTDSLWVAKRVLSKTSPEVDVIR